MSRHHQETIRAETLHWVLTRIRWKHLVVMGCLRHDSAQDEDRNPACGKFDIAIQVSTDQTDLTVPYQVREAILSLDASIQGNLAAAQDSTAIAADLGRESAELARGISFFTLASGAEGYSAGVPTSENLRAA